MELTLLSLLKFEHPSEKSLKRQLLLFLVNAGFEFFITDNFALDLHVKYIWNHASFEFKDSTGVTTASIDLNGFVAGVG